MKLYLQCSMGASGNMVMAALYELLPDKAAFQNKMQQLGLPGVTLDFTKSVKCGIAGTHISVRIHGVEEISDDEHSFEHGHAHDHHHPHNNEQGHAHSHAPHQNHPRYSYKEILELIQSLDLPDNVKANAIDVYKIIGIAEASVHGTTLDETHFHEVGSIDAVVDVVGCSLIMDILNVTSVIASPIHVGFGMVRCEHGVLPIPAPATAEILKGIPIYSGRIEGELCTPTGAALLKHFATAFIEMPPMSVKKIGYGMGTKDFEAANCLRAFLYEDAFDDNTVLEISCNLDDMTPEAIGAVFEVLLDNGALDVYTTPIMMKKSRHATKLSCLCTFDTYDALAALMIKHTTTLGVRTTKCERKIMERETKTVKTEYGDIRVKKAKGYGIIKEKPEYDDVLEASKKHDVPFQTVFDATKHLQKNSK